jgi:hypothetical protein
MRILNDRVIETHTIGVYPDGSLQMCPSLLLIPTDISVQEIYKQVVIPDVYQLENGIAIGSQFFVGTIHFIAGDHVELIDLGGLPGTLGVRHLCLISISTQIQRQRFCRATRLGAAVNMIGTSLTLNIERRCEFSPCIDLIR